MGFEATINVLLVFVVKSAYIVVQIAYIKGEWEQIQIRLAHRWLYRKTYVLLVFCSEITHTTFGQNRTPCK